MLLQSAAGSVVDEVRLLHVQEMLAQDEAMHVSSETRIIEVIGCGSDLVGCEEKDVLEF